MKSLLIIPLCTAILAGCSSPVANGGDDRDNYIKPPYSTSVKSQGNVLINGIVYILNRPPDKTGKDFFINDEKEKLLIAYYKPLLVALNKQNPIKDAEAAFKKGYRYFFIGSYGQIFKSTRENLYGRLTHEAITRCPGKAQLEGVNFIDKHSCQGVTVCDNFMAASGRYREKWNVAMMNLCIKN